MAITQQWYNYAFDECRAADAPPRRARGGSLGPRGGAPSSSSTPPRACCRRAALFRAQAPILPRPVLLPWAPATVEPALHCGSRLLRGAYDEPLPFWSATGMGKTDGSRAAARTQFTATRWRCCRLGRRHHREDTRRRCSASPTRR